MNKLVARKLSLDLYLGLATNELSNAKTGHWRTRKPLLGDALAPCTDACPAGIRIRDYLKLVQEGKLAEAWEVVKADNPLPAITGRVCYHPCEGICNRKHFDEPIAIHSIERFIGDYGLALRVPHGTIPPQADRIAIVGSGPAGLSAAYFLARRFYRVTVFEALPMAGGMLVAAIPEYRLPRDVLNAEIDSILKLGVELKLNTRVEDVDSLFEQGYKAVFIASGAGAGDRMCIPGNDAKGVFDAIEFLYGVNLGKKPHVGKSVAVVGGGNSAIDAARVALRQGANEVSILYRRQRKDMPAIVEEIDAAEQEGVQFYYLTVPSRVLSENGKVVSLECVRVERNELGSDGRRNPHPVAGSEYTIAVDTVIEAIGQHPDTSCFKDGRIDIRSGGEVNANPHTLVTSRPAVYAGGDVVSGPATVVEAIAAGKRAAQSIDAALRGHLPAEEKQRGTVSAYEGLNLDYFCPQPRREETGLPLEECRSTFGEVRIGLGGQAVTGEAKRCFHCGACNLCQVCSSFCPEGILSISEGAGFEADLDFCKGCGICATECPRGVVDMVLELQ